MNHEDGHHKENEDYTDICVVARIVQEFGEYLQVIADLAETPLVLALALQRGKKDGRIYDEDTFLWCCVRQFIHGSIYRRFKSFERPVVVKKRMRD